MVCFFVETGVEHIACNYLNKLLNDEECVAFVPQIELVFKNSRQIRKELRPMFLGYVFAEANVNARDFIIQTSQIVRWSNCVFKLLGKENPYCMPLREDEKEFLLGFCDDEYVVGQSFGVIEGDKVFVTSGPLQGKESVIKRIDRHKRRAEIELELVRDLRRVSMALEIVSKV